MKHLLYLFLFALIFTACATPQKHPNKQKEIATAIQRLGEEHYRNGRYTTALKHLLDAEKDLSDDPYLQNSLGLAYLAKKKPELAETHFKKALTLKPDYIPARNNLGGAYMKLEKWDLAIQSFEIVADSLLYATPEIPLSNLGWAYLNQGSPKLAMDYFYQALDIRPRFINPIHGIASIHILNQDYIRAKTFLINALQDHPAAAVLHSDLAKVYDLLGEIEEANKAWNVVLKLLPKSNSDLVKEAKKRLNKL